MKTKIFSIIALVAVISLNSCKDRSDETVKTGDSVDTDEAQVKADFPVDSGQVIGFTGYKPGASHTGDITISNGSFIINSNDNIEGNFVMDMKSLVITDGSEDKLRTHLLDKDFFDVAQYPEATFTITSVSEAPTAGDSSTVSGNLELKGISKNITFPALIDRNDSMIHAQAAFLINRTDWNLKYGNDAGLGDRFIKPEVMINFDITGHKKAAE